MRSLSSFWLLGGVLWVALLAGGWLVLLRYDLTPGSGGRVPERWPLRSALSLGREQPTLVLFGHRSCPCTRATLRELEQILARCSECVHVQIVLVAPAVSGDRVGRDLETLARSLPGAEVMIDPDGVEARRFSVRTSGHVVLYGADGCLLFSGGITDTRGHEGDSLGRQAVLALLRGEVPEQKFTPVYGCPLFADDVEREAEDESWNR